MSFGAVTTAIEARGLTPSAKVVLVAMSHVADPKKDPTGQGRLLYWGGWERLSQALGHEGAPATRASKVRRYIAELHAKDRIVVVRLGVNGDRAEYEIRPWGSARRVDGWHPDCLRCAVDRRRFPVDNPAESVDNPVDNDRSQGVQFAHPQGVQFAHPKGNRTEHNPEEQQWWARHVGTGGVA